MFLLLGPILISRRPKTSTCPHPLHLRFLAIDAEVSGECGVFQGALQCYVAQDSDGTAAGADQEYFVSPAA